MPGLFDVFAAPKAALLRAIGLPLLVLAVGRALGKLGRDGAPAVRPPDAEGWVDRIVIAWVVLAVLSAVAGLAPRVSVLGEIGQREGVLTTLALAGLWFGTRASHHDAAHTRSTLTVAFAAVAVAAAYALVQFAHADPLKWETVSHYGNTVRPSSTLGNPILLGALLAAVCAGGAAAIAAGAAGTPAVAPLLALVGAALAATLSRGAGLAATLGLLVGVAPALLSGPPARRQSGAIALAAAVLPGAVFAAVALRGALAARLGESAANGATSVPYRVEITRGALELWRAHPWLGTGPDTFGLAYTSVQSASLWRHAWFGLPANAHSAPLQLLVTTGALGALAVAAWVVAILFAARYRDPRAPRPALAAAVALAAASLTNPIGPAGAALLVVLGALLIRRPGATAFAPPPRFAVAAATFAAGAIVACAAPELAALGSAAHARADLLALDSPASAGAGRLALARAGAGAAERAAGGWSADDALRRLACDAQVARADAARGAGELRDAEDAAGRALAHANAALSAVARRSANAQRLADAALARARVARDSGAEDGETWAARADSAFLAARTLAPVDAMLLVDEARSNLATGRAEAARDAANRVVALYPEAAGGHALVAASFLAEQRLPEARAALERALAARWEEGSERQHAAALELLARLRAEGGSTP